MLIQNIKKYYKTTTVTLLVTTRTLEKWNISSYVLCVSRAQHFILQFNLIEQKWIIGKKSN